jgi:hypothetical protein
VITTWASIASNLSVNRQYILTIDSNQYSYFASATTETITITTTLSDWGANAGNSQTVSVNFSPTNCDCSSMAWTQPSITDSVINIDATSNPTINAPVSDDSLKTSVTAFGNCYENAGTCSTAGTYAADTDFTINDGTGAVSLPAWVTWNVGTQTMTLAPTDVALTGKTYTVVATYTPDYGTSTAFTVSTFTVDCVVTGFTNPSAPTGAALIQ